MSWLTFLINLLTPALTREGLILNTFGVQKNSFLDFPKIDLASFRDLLGIVLSPKIWTFVLHFSEKGR